MTNTGVLSLRCPACGRMFLSLPQQAGAYVTCPHCAQSATMTNFGSAQNSVADSLPMRRRVARPAEPSPSPPAWGIPPPAPYGGQSPFFAAPQTAPTAWPAAPEAPPPFTPPQAGASFSPPADLAAAWAAVTQPPQPVSSSPFTHSPFTAAPAQPVYYQSGVNSPWPQEPPAPSPQQAPAPLDFAAMRQSPPMEAEAMEIWQPPSQRTSVWPALLFLLLVVGTCLWVLRDDLLPPMIAEIPAPQAETEPRTATTTPASIPAAAPAMPSRTPPAASEPEAAPEIRRAEIPKPELNLALAGESGRKLFLDLLEATTPQQRAQLIDQPEEHAADLEEFFAAGQPQLLSMKSSNATPQTLPGHEVVPLFQVTTKANPHGALLRLVPQKDGRFLLDWPLFAETHQRRLAQFLEAKPTQPGWFQVGMRRSHGLELPEAMRSIQLAFTLQGSADASVSCIAVSQKDTPIGRYLARETEWTTVYVARLLLQHRQLADGTPAVVILDCEGAATASAP